MRKYLYGILLLWMITYVLSGCSRMPVEESGFAGGELQGTAEAEPSAVPASGTASTHSPVFNLPSSPSPEPTPSSSPVPDSPVSLLEYGELMSSMLVLPSTEDYEKYLTQNLCFHEACKNSEDGTEYGDFDICLPQFGKNMPCYRELNTYFEELYAQLLLEKENFHVRVKEAGEENSRLWRDDYSYCGMTIGEQYLTVYVMNIGYCGGIRDYIYPMPVTFDLTTGKPVTLQEILGCSEAEIVELAADYVYGYFLSQGMEYVRRNTYLCYRPQDFYMLEQGLGVYYPRYAIDCGAAGDFLFVIPYDDLYARVSAHAFPTPKPPSPLVEIEYGEIPVSEGYEAYLEENMVYHDSWQIGEGGEEQGVFDICLPRFKESLPCYEQINAYFVNWFDDTLDTKEEYYGGLTASQEIGVRHDSSCRKLYYEGMTIGERYLTVYTVRDEGENGHVIPVPVTFELITGEPVTLPEILGCSEQETAALVDNYVYEYCYNQGIYSWGDVLWFAPEQFYMLEQGLGVYYRHYTIDSQEHLYIIPYAELSGI